MFVINHPVAFLVATTRANNCPRKHLLNLPIGYAFPAVFLYITSCFVDQKPSWLTVVMVSQCSRNSPTRCPILLRFSKLTEDSKL